MKVLHTISSLQQSAGTSVFCVELADHLTALNVDCSLSIFDIDPEDVLLPRLCLSPTQINSFANCSKDYDIIHTHALWNMLPHKAVRFGVKNNIPICISPHGMLTPWALNNSKWKKKLAMMLYQWRDLKSASMFHATAENEVENIRRLGLKQPVVIAPLGVNLLDLSFAQKARSGAHDPRKVILLISRIHPIKGLMNLLDAWSVVRDRNWRIVIAGPDERGHVNELKQKAVNLGIAEDVSFVGTVYGNDKDRLYLESDLFVLPSFSENFGVVVLEALAAGLPVITTKGTPWEELLGKCENVEEMRECENVRVRECCGLGNAGTNLTNELISSRTNGLAQTGRSGWWIDIGVQPLVQALQEAMNLSDVERAQMGQNGRKLVEEKYSWDSIAAEMGSAYEWILHGGGIPACVRVE